MALRSPWVKRRKETKAGRDHAIKLFLAIIATFVVVLLTGIAIYAICKNGPGDQDGDPDDYGTW